MNPIDICSSNQDLALRWLPRCWLPTLRACVSVLFRYMGMGVSGGEEGARLGPALMPGGSPEGYEAIKCIVEKIAAQVLKPREIADSS